MKMDIILSKWCLAILFAFGILACTDGGDANELPKEPEGTGETQDEKIPAFPGAEGHGRYTTGGRGGDVYIVTSLEDKLQNGTLRYGIEKLSGKRTIIFQVSGTIHLNGDLKIKNGDLTIAGQTAPGDGICLAGYPVFLEADNVIVRFMRFRMGNKEDVSADGADAFGGRYHRNIMIDHCSMSWCTDECVSFYQNENFTLQWCLISESLRLGGHTKGPHGYGGIWGGMKASFHHNLLAHHDSRNPRFCHPGITSVAGVIDFRNNVIYNWGKNSSYGGDTRTINIVNNYYKPGPATEKNRSRIFQPYLPCGKFYIEGNYVEGEPKVTNSNWLGVKPKGEVKMDTVLLWSPLPYEAVSTQPAEQAYKLVLEKAGASLVRDKIDSRVVEEVRKGTYTYGDKGMIDSQNQVGGFLKFVSQTSIESDSDNDGMPDIWEVANNLDPNNPEDASEYTLDKQYTNIEVYINSLIK